MRPPTFVFVKIGALGDLVMFLPTIRTARREHPEARLVLVVGRSLLPLARLIEEVDELVPIDDQALYRGSRWQQVMALLACARQLRWRRVERLMIGHSDKRYRLFARMVRARRVDCWDRGRGRQFPVPGRFHPDEYLRLYHGVDHAGMPKAELYRLARQLPLSEELAGRSPVVALAPGGARNLVSDAHQKRWPVTHYAELTKLLLAQGHTVLITGAPSDTWVREYFAGLPVLDLVGRTDIPALVALYQRCELVITHDSGPMHVAGLAGAKRLALFGGTSPDWFLREDARSRMIWLGRDMACSPCYDGRTYADCQSVACLANITPERVLQMALSMLKENE